MEDNIANGIKRRVMKDQETLGTGLVSLIVLGVALLGDMMYIQLMHGVFPSGILFVFCIVGAFASFLSMCYLLIGKHVFFHPGIQMNFAWGLVAVDIVITALNIIDVFYGGKLGGWLNMWTYLAPCTPLIIMACVLAVHFSSPAHEGRHKEMAYADELADLERDFRLQRKRVDYRLKEQALGIIEQMATHDMHTPEEMARLAGISRGYIAESMSGLTGYALPPMSRVELKSPTVEGTLETASTQQTGSIDTSVPLVELNGRMYTVDELTKLVQAKSIDTESLPAQKGNAQKKARA